MVKQKVIKKVKPSKKSVPKAKKQITKAEKKSTPKAVTKSTPKQAKKSTKKVVAKAKSGKKQSKFYTTDLIKPTEDQIKLFEQSISGAKKKEIQGKESYHLYEDLIIILEVVKLMKDNSEEKQSFWKSLAEKKILKRSQESLRDRFKRQLRYLSAKDYATICSHLKSQGDCQGYLEFQFAKGKFLNSVTLEDPRIIKNPSTEKAAK